MPEQFKLTKDALADLRNIAQYTREKYGVEPRNRYLSELHKRFAQIGKRPHMGRERPEIEAGVRSVVEGKHVVFYQVAATGVEVLNILHPSMDLKRQADRSRRGGRNRGEGGR